MRVKVFSMTRWMLLLFPNDFCLNAKHSQLSSAMLTF